MSNPLSDTRMAAFIGPRWPTYRKKFARFREEPAFTPTWNWSAALLPFAWFLYRKLYFAALAAMFAPGLFVRLLTGSDVQLTQSELQKPENEALLLVYIGVWLSTSIAAGGTGNWLLFRRAKAAVQLTAMQSLDDGEALPWLARVGGVNRTGAALVFAVLVAFSLVNALA
jgi:hypothetical protein